MVSPVNTGISNRRRAWYMTSHPGQLSLSIAPSVGSTSSGDGFNNATEEIANSARQ